MERLPLAEKLIDKLGTLGLYLKPEGLAEPKRLVRAGQPIRGWLDAFLAGLNGLAPLIAYAARRQQCVGATATILQSLEDYESARIRRDIMLDPPTDLAPDSYGAWWVALVKYAASPVGR